MPVMSQHHALELLRQHVPVQLGLLHQPIKPPFPVGQGLLLLPSHCPAPGLRPADEPQTHLAIDGYVDTTPAPPPAGTPSAST